MLTAEQMNAEANAFALELLMPEDWIVREVRAAGGVDIEDSHRLEALAKRFRVSVNMMIFRLGQIHERRIDDR